MKTTPKKITSLFFILLGLVPLLFVLLTTIRKQDIRKEMKEKLEHLQLQTLVLPENEVTWMDEHEIWVNQSMFDIHSKKLENGIYTFTGLYDEKETLLVELERNAAGKNNEQNELLAQLFKSLPGFYDQNSETGCPELQFVNYSFFIPQNTVRPFRKILTPPPQVCRG